MPIARMLSRSLVVIQVYWYVLIKLCSVTDSEAGVESVKNRVIIGKTRRNPSGHIQPSITSQAPRFTPRNWTMSPVPWPLRMLMPLAARNGSGSGGPSCRTESGALAMAARNQARTLVVKRS